MTMGMRIMWFSVRHTPCEAQRRELERLFPGHELICCNKSFASITELVDMYEKMEGDEMVVILPMTMIKLLVEFGYRPLRSILVETNRSNWDILEKNRAGQQGYRFEGFERVTGVNVTTEKL